MSNKYFVGNQEVDASFIAIEMIWQGMIDERIKEQVGILHPDVSAKIIKGRE